MSMNTKNERKKEKECGPMSVRIAAQHATFQNAKKKQMYLR